MTQTASTFQSPSERHAPLTVLGIESSCDETAAAIIRLTKAGDVEVLSSCVASQNEEHAPYGGVVPEIAARAHMRKIDDMLKQALNESNQSWSDLDAVAATAGPGLIGGVMTGLMAAKGLALALDIPLIAVNHLEGHALSARLSHRCPFPYLLLLVSGGHTQLLSVTGVGSYTRLGSTIDDAAGEAFDKTAKLMALGFPGGPALEQMAHYGNEKAFDLPKPLCNRPGADFSFAGLKTATRRALEKMDNSCEQAKADLAASFQKTVADILVNRTQNAMDMFKVDHAGPLRFVVAGGVAANTVVREKLEALCRAQSFEMFAPPLKYCGDNAAMIALAGAERLKLGQASDLAVIARPRWPLDEAQAISAPKSGYGKKGPKS